MSIIASFDKCPVYLDNNGYPLSSGKIHYYAIGTTTPKTVYTDYALTVPAANPQICGIDGRTPTQIFLGQGQYTCVSRKFNGTDPMMSSDTDWDNVTSQWVEEGQPTPSIATLTDAVYVTTIANLRLVDANSLGKNNFVVMGYYTEGDVFPRTYHWDASYLGADNKGTIIKNPSISTGAFILDVGNTDVMDCRIFGIIHNRASSNNAAIAAMVTDVQNNAKLPQTIYFPRGTYEVVGGTQYFDTKVIFDEQCQFKSTSGTYILGIRDEFECYSTQNIKSTSSVGDVYFNFSSANHITQVDVRWYGAIVNGITDDAIALVKLNNNCTHNHPILISGGTLKVSALSGNIILYRDVICRNGIIDYANSTYTLTFAAPGKIVNENIVSESRTRCFSANNLNKLRFVDYSPVSLSVFVGIDVLAALKAINPYLVTKQTFLIDQDIYTDSTLLNGEASNIILKHVTGLMYGSGNVVVFNGIDAAPTAQVFASHGFIVSGVNAYIDWFPNTRSAIYAVLTGGSTLDLCGKTVTASATPLTITTLGNDSEIKNGTIQLSGAGDWITINATDAVNSLRLDNLNIQGYSFNVNMLKIFNVTLPNLTINSCNFGSTGIGTAIAIDSTATVAYLSMVDSNVVWYQGIIQSATHTGQVHIYDNKLIRSINLLCGSNVFVSNNQFRGNTGYVTTVSSSNPAVISGNSFYQHYLSIASVAAKLKGIITNNFFYSTDTQISVIWLSIAQVNTYVTGLIIEGNAFSSTATVYFRGIEWNVTGSFATSQTGNIHSMSVCNNTGRAPLLGVPQTKVSVYVNSGDLGGAANSYTVGLASYAGDLLFVPDSNIQLGSATVTKPSSSYLSGAVTYCDDLTTYAPWTPKIRWGAAGNAAGPFGQWVNFSFYNRT